MDSSVDPADRQVEEISSLCMNCHEEGTTKLLLTRIPFFREIVLTSFSCPSCHFTNSEIQSAGEIQQQGVQLKFKLDDQQDLQRQVVKSDSAVIRLEEIDLEIPKGRGQLTNLEGLVNMVKGDLEVGQPSRKEISHEVWMKVEAVIQTLETMLSGQRFPFTISVNDPTGNSSIEPSPEDQSGKYTRSTYPRTAEQNEELGLAHDSGHEENRNSADMAAESVTGAPPPTVRPEYSAAAQMYPAPPASAVNGHIPNYVAEENGASNGDDGVTDEIVENQVYTFEASCPGCMRACHTRMKMVRIPHFSEVVIMATTCDACGYKTNEVKSGGAIPEKGRRITLKVNSKEDLSRDILKSESCAMECPELRLNVEPGTLGGRFTTIEGLITQVRDDLRSSVFDAEGANLSGAANESHSGSTIAPAIEPAQSLSSSSDGGGDSMAPSAREKWKTFFGAIDSALAGTAFPFTLVLTDPLAQSYVQSFAAPAADDNITVEDYDRTEQEMEDLGLNDIHVEGYEKASTDIVPKTETANEDTDPIERPTLQDLTEGTGGEEDGSK